EVYVIENNTTVPDISFETPQSASIARNARNIAIGDLNGDAKPDIAYSEGVTLNTNGGLGVLVNSTAIEPTFDPPSFTYCSGSDFTLETVNSPNATYRWTVTPSGSVPTTTDNEATFSIVSSSDQTISVEIIQESDTVSGEIIVEYAAFSISATPTINVNDVNGGASLCEGEALVLSTTTSFYSYLWTLPDGSTATTPTFSIPEVAAGDAGPYSLIVRNTGTSGTCSSDPVTENISVETFPPPVIFNEGTTTFCADGANDPMLQTGSLSGGSYQWRQNGTNLSGETGSSLTTSTTGTYTVQVINSNGCAKESGSIDLQAVSEPVSVITGATATCNGLPTSFTASSTGQAGFTLNYFWEVDSAGIILATSTDPDFTYTFNTATASDYRLTLSTSYPSGEVAACTDEQTITVSVSLPPLITFNVLDRTQKCPAESLDVEVTNTDISSYDWLITNAANNDTIIFDALDMRSIAVETPPEVDSVYAVVNIFTNIGCEVRDSILIRNFPTSADIGSPDFESILNTDSATLEDGISIDLEALNFVSDLSWEPAVQIDNPTAASVSFFPKNPTSTVTLTGIDEKGCLISSRVIVILDNIRPKRTFSPNGDGENDCWEILNIGDLGETLGCKIYVFDARGRNEVPVITQFDNGNCVWDGTSSGSPVPEGIYYFVLKCSEDAFSRSGSILLAR
ncbi:MAG: T9SS type B sorting domain-containing protein, partial [Ekhidna sp.]|nr:T9SS type B sorting domain-containing protein [Ekhidna sp.]